MLQKIDMRFDFILVFVFCFIVKTTGAQDSIAVYYDKHNMTTKIVDSARYFRVKCVNEEKWEGEVKHYYISGKLKEKTTYSNGKRNGSSVQYFENGFIMEMGKYENSSRQGEWLEYYQNGNLKYKQQYKYGWNVGSIVSYFHSGKTHKIEDVKNKDKGYEVLVMEMFDSLGNSLVKNGTGKAVEIDFDDRTIETGEYKDGRRHGKWKYTDAKGSPIGEFEYRKGECVSARYHSSPIVYDAAFVSEQAEYPGGMSELMSHLRKNIKYPSDCKEANIQGKVYIEFQIMLDGKVENIKIKRGVYKSLDEEAIRVVKLMPKWKPATYKRRTVVMRYVLPINFKLN